MPHQGHGPRAEQTGRIHMSDFRYPVHTRLRTAAGPYICAIARHSPRFRLALNASCSPMSAFGWKGDPQICAILLGNRRPEIGGDDSGYSRFSPIAEDRRAAGTPVSPRTADIRLNGNSSPRKSFGVSENLAPNVSERHEADKRATPSTFLNPACGVSIVSSSANATIDDDCVQLCCQRRR